MIVSQYQTNSLISRLCRICSLCLLLCLGFNSTLVAAEVDLDPQLEQRLDQYLQQSGEDPLQAKSILLALENEVLQVKSPYSKARYFNYVASEYARSKDFRNANLYLEKVLALAEETQAADIYTEYYAEILRLHWLQEQNSEAAETLPLMLEYAEAAEQSRVRYYAFSTAANFQNWRSNFKDALTNLHKAAESIEHSNNPRTALRKLTLQSSMAELNASLRNNVEALKIIQAILPTALQEKSFQPLLADFYLQECGYLVDLNRLTLAEAACKNALQWAEKLNNSYALNTATNNIGDIYMRLQRFDEAQQYFEKSLRMAQSMADGSGVLTAQFNLGYIKVHQGQPAIGIPQMEAMLKDASNSGSDREIMSYLLEMADAYHLAKLYLKEAATLRHYIDLSKTIFQSDRDKQLSQLQEEFSAKEKMKQIAALEQQNLLKEAEIQKRNLQQRVMFLIGIVVILATVMLFQLYRKVRSANDKLKAANDQLAFHSLHDPLTGLLNRRSFHEQMQRREQIGERRQAATHDTDGFILLDIDYFKHINDHFGHAAGDAVLVEIGKRLKSLTRTDDMVLRWGGEEFLILLRRVDQAALTTFSQRVLDIIGQQPIFFQGNPIQVTASAGFLTLPFSGLDEQTLNWEKALQLADMALYLGKVHGRNRAYGLVKLNADYESIREQLEKDLSQAIDKQQLTVTLILGPEQPKTT